MKEIVDIWHMEIVINGIDEFAVSINMEPVHFRVRQCWYRRRKQRPIRSGNSGARDLTKIDVCFGGGGRLEAFESHGGQNRFEFFMGHDWLEVRGVPKSELLHTFFHAFLHPRWWCGADL